MKLMLCEKHNTMTWHKLGYGNIFYCIKCKLEKCKKRRSRMELTKRMSRAVKAIKKRGYDKYIYETNDYILRIDKKKK